VSAVGDMIVQYQLEPVADGMTAAGSIYRGSKGGVSLRRAVLVCGSDGGSCGIR